MKKSLIMIAFVGALVLALPAWAQEGEGQPAPGPTQQTIEVDRGPRAPRHLEPKHGVRPGPETGEDEDPAYEPGDPLELLGDRRATTVPSQVASPSSGGLTLGAGGSGASTLAAAGRFGGAVSSFDQDARRGIRQLIRQLEGN